MVNINADQNPEYVNSFLDYSLTILNKSPNSVKEYNYDLTMFLRYIKIQYHLTNETDFNSITIKDIPLKLQQELEKYQQYEYFFHICLKKLKLLIITLHKILKHLKKKNVCHDIWL